MHESRCGLALKMQWHSCTVIRSVIRRVSWNQILLTMGIQRKKMKMERSMVVMKAMKISGGRDLIRQ